MAVWLTPLLLVLDLLYASEEKTGCGGQFWCVPFSEEEGTTQPTIYYHYISSNGVCEELPQSRYTDCVPAVNCTFSSAKECYHLCGKEKKNMADCSATQYGCCGDGVTVRQGEEGCPDQAVPTGGGGGGGGIGWGVVTSTVSGVAILLGVVAIVSFTIITYRRRQRYRNRWYIHEVLQMYDGGDSSSDSGAASDNSWDDPEHNNLFDRL